MSTSKPQDADQASDPTVLTHNDVAADLAAIDANDGGWLAEHASAIRSLRSRAVGHFIEIGRRLVECKQIVGHGNWMAWLDREFGWSTRTAEKFMQVSTLQKFAEVGEFDVSLDCLCLVGSKNTPETAREELLERAKRGEKVTTTEAANVVRKHKPRTITERARKVLKDAKKAAPARAGKAAEAQPEATDDPDASAAAMKAAHAAAEAKNATGTDEQKRHHKAVMISVERHDNVVDTAVKLYHQGTDIVSLADLSREQRDDVISLLQEMQATIFSAISCLREMSPPPSGPGGEPEPKVEEPAETVSTVADPTALTIDHSLDIPACLLRTAEAAAPDSPVPLTPSPPAPAPSPPARPPSPSPVRARRKREKYPENEADLLAAGFVKSQQCGVYMRPWPDDWERLGTDDLEVIICRTQTFGGEHGCEEQVRPQLEKMVARLKVLRAADRAAARVVAAGSAAVH